MLFQTVQQDCAENDQPENYFLGVALDIGQIHAVLNNGDDKCAYQGAENFALSPAQTCATDYYGGDYIKLV